MNATPKKRPELAATELIESIPLACADEQAAIRFFEAHRWGEHPCCPRCGDTNVYTIMDRKTGERRLDGRWRCRGCGFQYTVRVGMIMEDSPVPLHKWARAYWTAAVSKNGVSALELSRMIQVTYKSALFMMHRIRHAMADGPNNPPPKLSGTVEVDETFVGGKPRGRPWRRDPGAMKRKPRAKWSVKVPVVAAVQRGGDVRASVVNGVSARNLKRVMNENIERGTAIMTDERPAYRKLVRGLGGTHGHVRHWRGEYVDAENPIIHTNTIEGFFARVKRQLTGTYHAVSREHLFRYTDHAEWLYNARRMNDGERVTHLVKCSNGKRLRYRMPDKKAS